MHGHGFGISCHRIWPVLEALIALPLASGGEEFSSELAARRALACSEPWQDIVYRFSDVAKPERSICDEKGATCDRTHFTEKLELQQQLAHHLSNTIEEVCLHGKTYPQGNIVPISKSAHDAEESVAPKLECFQGKCGFDRRELDVQPSNVQPQVCLRPLRYLSRVRKVVDASYI